MTLVLGAASGEVHLFRLRSRRHTSARRFDAETCATGFAWRGVGGVAASPRGWADVVADVPADMAQDPFSSCRMLMQQKHVVPSRNQRIISGT